MYLYKLSEISRCPITTNNIANPLYISNHCILPPQSSSYAINILIFNWFSGILNKRFLSHLLLI